MLESDSGQCVNVKVCILSSSLDLLSCLSCSHSRSQGFLKCLEDVDICFAGFPNYVQEDTQFVWDDLASEIVNQFCIGECCSAELKISLLAKVDNVLLHTVGCRFHAR